MVYVLECLRESKAIRFCFKANLHKDESFIVLCRHKKLEATHFVEQKPYLLPKAEYTFIDEIEAAELVQTDRCEGILILLGNKLRMMVMHDYQWLEAFQIEIGQVQDHQNVLESGPRILYLQQFNSVILLIYLGYATNINLDRLPSRNGTVKSLKHPVSETFSFGNNSVVLLVCLLKNSYGLGFAVIHRDYEFKYGVQLYVFDESLCYSYITKNMTGMPSMIFLACGGTVVVTDLALHFYPKGVAAVSDKAGTPTYPVTRGVPEGQDFEQRVTLDLTGYGAIFHGSSFQAHTVIDESKVTVDQEGKLYNERTDYKERHLLISDTGETLLVYMHAWYVSHTTTVEDFRIVSLGKSTVASSLVYVGSNIFLAGSRLSQSVLFRILDTKPFIHILGFLSSTPPVLDIGIVKPGDLPVLVVAQGGQYSGETEIVSKNMEKAATLMSIGLPAPVVQADMICVTSDGYRFTTTAFDTRCEYILKFNPEPECDLVEQTHEWKEDTIQAFCADGTAITVRDGHLFYKQHKLALPGLIDATSIAMYENRNRIDVAVCLSSSKIYHVRIFGSKLTMVRLNKFLARGTFTAAFLSLGKHLPEIVVASSTGEVHHILSTGIIVVTKVHNVQGFLRIKSSPTSLPCLLLFDSRRVWKIEQFKDTMHFTRTLIYLSPKPVVDCIFIREENSLLVFHGTKTVTLFKPDLLVSTHPKYYSNGAVLKSKVLSTGEIVTVELEKGKNAARDQKSHLRLFSSMLDLNDTVETSVTYSDVCELGRAPDSESGCLIAAAADAGQTIDLYVVKNNKMALYSSFWVGEVLKGDAVCKLNDTHLISFKDGILTLTGDRLFRISMLYNDNGQISWSLVRDAPTPSFAIDYVQDEGVGIVADVSGGVLLDYNDARLSSVQLLPYLPEFVTAVAVLEKTHLIVYGDSVGNVAGVTFPLVSQSPKIVFAMNLGSQVNVIRVNEEKPVTVVVGTTSGEVWRLIDPEEQFSSKAVDSLMKNCLIDLEPLLGWRSMDKWSELNAHGVVLARNVMRQLQTKRAWELSVNRVYQGMLWFQIEE